MFVDTHCHLYDEYFADLTGDGTVTDNSDLVPRNVPENTFGLSTTYTANIGPGSLQGSLSFRYRDAVEHAPDNDPIGSMDSITDLSGQSATFGAITATAYQSMERT